MTKNTKRLLRTLVCLALFLVAVISKLLFKSIDGKVWLICFSVIYALSSYDVLRKAIRNICRGKVFDENFLMAIASLGALVLGEYTESCAVMIFYQIGECFQSYAVGKSRKSITALMDIRPDEARVIRDGVVIYDGQIGSLQREKDTVKEVKKGYECGITIENFNDIKVGDIIETYEIREKK